jgi:glucose-6-phosphate dehydrogenase assembly protein OpcA
MAGTISPDQILHEMADLWVSLGKQGEGEAGVLRACSMTFVVAAEESDDPQAIGETLAALMPEHPSRAILIRFQAEDQRELSARVFAQCWKPFSQRQQICCEQIEITASEASLPDLAAVVLPLAVPDLPVILWCRSPRLYHLQTFPQLSAIAQKLVLDSEAFGDPGAALKEMSAALASGRALADLTWIRLTRWRELISQIFENRSQLADLPRVARIRISHCGGVAPAAAWYMAAWLIGGLQQIGSRPQFNLESAGDEASGELQSVDLLPQDGADAIVSIRLVEGHAAEVRVGGLVHRALLPRLTDCALLREEFSIAGRDPIFERTLAAAAKLAVS